MSKKIFISYTVDIHFIMRVSRMLLFLFLIFHTTVIQAQSSLLPIKKSGKWGLIDHRGEVVTSPNFDAMTDFDQYGYAKVQQGGSVGLINPTGQLQLPIQFDDLQVLGQQFIEVSEGKKQQLLDRSGKIILDRYDDLMLWNEQLTTFEIGGKWGIINANGTKIATAQFDAFEPLGAFIVTKQGQKKGLIDETGKVILPCSTSEIKLHENIILYKERGFWGAINNAGKTLIAPAYSSFQRVTPYLIVFQQELELVALSLLTNQLVKAQAIDGFEPFSKDYLLVKKDNQYGLIRLNNEWVIPAQYEEILTFTSELLRYKNEEGWGIIDYTGEDKLNDSFDYIAPVQRGVSIIKKDGKYGLLDFMAQPILPPQYDKIELTSTQVRAFEQGKLTLLYRNEDGTIKDEQVNLNQHLTFNIRAKSEETEDQKRRLDNFEWYYNASSGKWGLRALKDGERTIEPQFDYVEVKKALGFTLVGLNNSTRYEFGQTAYQFEQLFGLVNNKIGKLVTPVDFLHIYFEDFEQDYPVARCIFSNGKFGLVDTIGRILLRDAAYIDEFQEGFARLAVYGKISGAINAEYKLQRLMPFLQSLQTSYFMSDYTADDLMFNKAAWLTCDDCIWGYINASGKTIVAPSYDMVLPFKNKVGLVQQEKKWGGINEQGKLLINCAYDDLALITNQQKTSALITHKSIPRYGLIDTLGNIIVNANYDEIGRIGEARIAIRVGQRWGFVDKMGKVIITPKYSEVSNFYSGFAAVEYLGKWGLIDPYDNIVIPFQYDDMGNFSEDIIWAQSGNDLLYVNQRGDQIIKTDASEVYDFRQGVARVVKNGKWGLIDKTGHYVVAPKFNRIRPFNENGLAIVQYGRERFRYGVINTKGDVITDHHYRYIYPFSEGLAAVKLKDKYGYINMQGKLIIPADYSRTSPFVEGKAAVQKEGVCGYINRFGKVVVDFKYSKCLEFSSGKAVVYKGYRKAGLVNQQGQQVIQPSLNRLLDFEEGRGLMRDANYRFYYITEDADLYDGYYEEASGFQNGVAVVRVGDKWGIINKKGIKVIPPKYDKIEPFNNGLAEIKIKGLYGLMTKNGEVLLPLEYERINLVTSNILRVEKGDAVGYITTEGKWIWQLEYK